MRTDPAFNLARALALGIPALLLGGAYIGQYAFDLYPCEMCWWQRWPHLAAIMLAFFGTFLAAKRVWVALAAGGILTSGLIGGFHAGVEYGWWEGITGCALLPGAGGGNPLDAIMGAPMIRCDQAPWELFGISLAGWNFLISAASALVIFALLVRGRTAV